MTKKNVRVRFAPSPTGFLHVGGARTALFNWLFARHSGGQFILRIEDTDRERSKPEYEEAILRDMKWLGLDWDEGPFRQTERGDIYRQQMEKLLASGNAYPCFCSPDELTADREAQQAAGKPYRYSRKCAALDANEAKARMTKEPHAIRLRVSPGQTVIKDIVRGEVTIDHQELDDLVLVRRGGVPTYNFVVVVDDALMGMTHVIRGDDHLPNTPKQILIYKALGFEPPLFAHIPLILGPDRSPLSKRHGASSVSEFTRQGYLPETMMNYLALLGWSFDDKTEIFSREELIERFSLDRVVKSAAAFDYDKLQWLNGQYLRKLDEARYFELCFAHLLGNKTLTEADIKAQGDYYKKVLLLVRDNLKLISQVDDHLGYFVKDVDAYDPAGLAKFKVPENIPVFEKAIELLDQAGSMEAAKLEEGFRQAATQMGKKFGEMVHPLRLALTGRMSSPSLFAVMEILGKDRTNQRLKRFLQLLKS